MLECSSHWGMQFVSESRLFHAEVFLGSRILEFLLSTSGRREPAFGQPPSLDFAVDNIGQWIPSALQRMYSNVS